MAGNNEMPDYHVTILMGLGVVSRDHFEVSDYSRDSTAHGRCPIEVGKPNVHNIRQDLHGFRGQVHVAVP